jgi:acyl-CoA thioesterase FadM
MSAFGGKADIGIVTSGRHTAYLWANAIRRLPSNTVLLNLHDTALQLAFKSIWSAEMYRVRFLLIILRCLISATAPVESERRLSFRAVPFIDTDVTRMFTHSYALFMGLARWHLLFGSQFRKLALRHKWAPVTTGEMIDYRRSIRAFQKFELRTRVIYWDENRFYVEQSFNVSGQMFVSALVEGLVRSPQGVLKPAAVFAQAGYDGPAPEPSQEMKERIACLKKSSSPRGPSGTGHHAYSNS